MEDLHESSEKIFFIGKNRDYANVIKKYVLNTSFNQLLNDLRNLFGLDYLPSYLIRENGEKILSNEEICDGDRLFLPNRIVNKKLVLHPKVDTDKAIINDTLSIKSDAKTIITDKKKISPYIKYQAFISSFPISLEEHIQRSLLCEKFSKNEFDDSSMEEIRRISLDTFLSLLRSEDMYCNSCFSREMDEWALDSMKDRSLDRIKFAIIGANQSGRSTSLFHLSNVLFRKLTYSQEMFSYIVFPINFQHYEQFFSSFRVLYSSIITKTVSMLLSIHFEYWLLSGSIREWLLNIPYVGSIIQPPNSLPINIKNGLINLAKHIKGLMSDKSLDSGINSQIFMIPSMIAQAFGLKGVIYIVDNVDCCPDAIQSDILKIINSSSYIVSCINEKRIKSLSYFPLSTEGILNNDDHRVISLVSEKLSFDIKSCKGCPGYVDKYIKVCSLYEMLNTNKRDTSSHIQTIQVALRFETRSLLYCLSHLKPEWMTEELSSSVQTKDFDISVSSLISSS